MTMTTNQDEWLYLDKGFTNFSGDSGGVGTKKEPFLSTHVNCCRQI